MCGIVQTNVIHLTNSYVCPGLRCTQYSLEPTVTAEQLQSSPTTAQLNQVHTQSEKVLESAGQW